MRVIFYFSPPPSLGSPPKRVAVPAIAPSVCNVAFLDNTTQLAGANASGWVPRRLAHWPYPKDGPRTAHLLKVWSPGPHTHRPLIAF